MWILKDFSSNGFHKTITCKKKRKVNTILLGMLLKILKYKPDITYSAWYSIAKVSLLLFCVGACAVWIIVSTHFINKLKIMKIKIRIFLFILQYVALDNSFFSNQNFINLMFNRSLYIKKVAFWFLFLII